MSTLYRDYRPQKFSEVLGQNHIKLTLQNEISADNIAQAFLFCGPRAVGKTTLARVLAKAINCLERKKGSFEPCNKCVNCKSITQGNNLDIIEIDAASNTGVDNVRENIISFSRLQPSGVKYKVFIIDEVHMLSVSAFNALLKIIEEPPTYVVFILCTTEIHKVPLTIISRCERYDFKRISVSDIVNKLSYIASAEKIEIDKEVLEAVARRSGGHLRDAESLLGQIFSLGDKKISLEQAELVIPHYNSNEAVDLLDYLSRKDAAKAINLVNGLVDSGANIKNFNTEIINLLRKMIINKLSPGLTASLGLDLGESLEIRLNQLENNLSAEQLLNYIRLFLAAYNDKNLLIPQLPLELALVEICSDNATIKNLSDFSKGQENKIENKTAPKALSPKSNKIATKESESLPTSSISNSAVFNCDHLEVMEKWPEFLVKIKKYNHSLSFVLQNCNPQEINDNVLSLIFKYKFHQDRINDVNIKNIVENTLREVYLANISFKATVDENLEIKKNSYSKIEEDSGNIDNSVLESAVKEKPETVSEIKKEGGTLMDNLLKTFGGEVIN